MRQRGRLREEEGHGARAREGVVGFLACVRLQGRSRTRSGDRTEGGRRRQVGRDEVGEVEAEDGGRPALTCMVVTSSGCGGPCKAKPICGCLGYARHTERRGQRCECERGQHSVTAYVRRCCRRPCRRRAGTDRLMTECEVSATGENPVVDGGPMADAEAYRESNRRPVRLGSAARAR